MPPAPEALILCVTASSRDAMPDTALFHGKPLGETRSPALCREVEFHVEHTGETPPEPQVNAPVSDFDRGLVLGILSGAAHFGGDGRQPQITLKMHVRHEPLLRRLLASIPGGRLYGPYFHGGRRYFQLMFRGQGLRTEVVPLLDALPWEAIDPYSYERYQSMKQRYRIG